MSKEEIIAALQAKFGDIPYDTISGIAEKLAKTADPSATDANTLIKGITFADIVKSYGDSRAQSAAQTAVRNYERKFQLKDGAPITPNTPPQTPADTTPHNNPNPNIISSQQPQQPAAQQPQQPAAQQQPQQPQQPQQDIAALIAQAVAQAVSPLQDLLNQYKGQQLQTARKSRYEAAIKPLPEGIRKQDLASSDRMSCADDEDFEQYMTQFTQETKAIADDIAKRATVMTPPKSANAPLDITKVDPMVINRVNRINAEAQAAPSPFVSFPQKGNLGMTQPGLPTAPAAQPTAANQAAK